MNSPQAPDPVAAPEPSGVVGVLTVAAEAAARAPSILNTQPWRWRVRDEALELHADRARQIRSIDPQGRLLTLSCGAALHHARVALAASGHEVTVARFPDPADPGLFARVRVTGTREVSYHDLQIRQAMRDRRTDRRPFAGIRPVPATVLTALVSTAQGEHALLHHVGFDQLPFLTMAARMAQDAETVDEQYLADLRTWTRRSHATGQGVPAETIMTAVTRPVPLRDFAIEGETLLHPGFGDDQFAEYLIVATYGDGPGDWLAAGEATSAVWLTATTQGLAVSPLSDVVEVPDARTLVGSLLARSGHPQLVLRVGFDRQPTPPPASPRRRADIVVDPPKSEPPAS